MSKVLLVAAIGRGHALAKKFHQSGVEVYSLIPFANPGIISCSKEHHVVDITNAQTVAKHAERIDPDYVWVAGDESIAAGVADAVQEVGVPAIAPLKTVARLESDKAFAREFMKEYVGHACPRFECFTDAESAKNHIDVVPYDFVIKPMGLTGGKGVKVLGSQLKDREEAKAYAEEAIAADRIGGIVIEEKLEGEEFSLQCFVDGESFAAMPLCQDHKPAYDGDLGPMTGGMGTYTCEDGRLPFVSDEEYDAALNVVEKTVSGVKAKTGEAFKGVLYAQFMLTRNGPFVIEYNARLGDPEAMNVLPLMKTNFHDVCKAIVDVELERFKVEFEPQASVCKYVVPEGYPERKDQFEFSLDESKLSDVELFYSGVEQKNGKRFTTGSRGFGLTALGANVAEAYQKAENALSQLDLKGFRYRKDIASEASIAAKIQHMELIRGRPATVVPAPPASTIETV
ncbi:phosphoribosylamine--glycine ligase [Candidatus Micrarchaeota archaeon]|nr:phosphoribosylamine--glycine ligase [Candidatus Micrarchaeota archaeon]